MNALNPTRARLLETFGLDLEMVRGDGARIFDQQGREYLDFLSQYGALPFGHNPAEVWRALMAVQTAAEPAMIQPLRALEAERLAERLVQITPFDLGVVMLANSGAEAVEAAIKLARARSGRDVILSTRNGFHGKTLGALSATGKSIYQRDFGAPAGGFEHIAFGDLAALEERLQTGADRIAAFIVEPIQGEGGVVIPPEGYLDGALALCRRHGVLSIVDEIQTGLGRTGRLFACGEGDTAPDILLLGKALGGGLMPISACIARPEVWDDRFGLLHSSTFANSNLAAAAANASLDLLLRGGGSLIERVARDGEYLGTRLGELAQSYPQVIREVRNRGYMAAIEFHKPVERGDSGAMAFCGLNGGFIALLSSYLLNVGRVLTAPVFNDAHVMRLQPPLIAGRAEIDHCIAALDQLCHLLARGDYSGLMRHMLTPERRARLVEAAHVPPQQGPSRAAEGPVRGRFAFLIHYTEEADIYRSDPSFARFTEDERAAFLQWVKRAGPGFAWPVAQGRSRTGATVEGMIMSVPLLPADMIGKGRSGARAMIQTAADMAAEYGAGRLGLGAFTSIVTNGGAAVAGRGVPVTSGNTLTTVAAVTAIERVARRVGLDPAGAHVVVVGATGSIGRLASLMLARRVGRLTLVGNARNSHAPKLLGRVARDVVHVLMEEPKPLGAGALNAWMRAMLAALKSEDSASDDATQAQALAEEVAVGGLFAPVATTTDLEGALATADIVLVATSADIALVDPRSLRPGTIVCDVARPPNVAQTDLAGHPVLVFDGGLVQPPFPIDLGPFQTLPANLCWGCLGETMLLALEGETADYSLGRDLVLAEADRIAAMARKHGFEPAEPQWHGSLVEEDQFARVAGALRSRARPEGYAKPAAARHLGIA